MRRRWLWRGVLAVVLLVALDVALVRFDFAPDHLRLGLVVMLVFVVGALVVDCLGESGPPWTVEPARPLTVPGADPALAAYVRLIEGHLTAATPDTALRDRLRALCDERLARRNGLTRDDPGAVALLGQDLVDDLAGPARRLTRQRIDDHLRRIEEI